MKITESQLRRIVREEILRESSQDRQYYLLRLVQEPQHLGDPALTLWTEEAGPFTSFSDAQMDIGGYDRETRENLTIAVKDSSGGYRKLSRTTGTDLGYVKPESVV